MKFFGLEKLFTKQPKVVQEPAVIVTMFNKNQEDDDLMKKHGTFFNELSPEEQLQSRINTSAPNIEDITPSRSQIFFKNAPEVKSNNQEDFEKLEEYIGVELHKHEIETGDLTNF